MPLAQALLDSEPPEGVLDAEAYADLRGFLAASHQLCRSDPEVVAALARSRQAWERGELAEARALAGGALAATARHRPRFLMITAGTAGSGKSTVASLLARRWGIVHLQTDIVRKGLVGLAPTARTGSAVYGGIYTPAMSDRTYGELARQAAQSLHEGRSVVVDGSFLTRSRRSAMLAVGRGVSTAILCCVLDRQEKIRRLQVRQAFGGSVSEGGPEVMARHELDWEPILPSEADEVVEIDTGSEPGRMEAEVLLLLWGTVLRFG
jgi:predicted kinase